MTMTRGYAPMLDRIIERRHERPVQTVTTYRFDETRFRPDSDGQWERRENGARLLLNRYDADHQWMPTTLELPAEVVVTVDGGTPETLTVEKYFPPRDIDTWYELQVTPPLSVTGSALSIDLPAGGDVETVAEEIWAQERDPSSIKNEVRATETSFLTVSDRIFVVREQSGPWSKDDAFWFGGDRWSVRGVGPLLGRGRFLQLFSRRIV